MRTGKKYFKDGNPEIYAYLNDTTWKRMTDRERAKWTPYSEVDQAPIPKEVLEFTKQRDEKDARIAELEAQLEKSKRTVNLDIKVPKVEVPVEVKSEPTEDDKKKALIAQLQELGIKATMNYKLETLEKKLSDANNSE